MDGLGTVIVSLSLWTDYSHRFSAQAHDILQLQTRFDSLPHSPSLPSLRAVILFYGFYSFPIAFRPTPKELLDRHELFADDLLTKEDALWEARFE